MKDNKELLKVQIKMQSYFSKVDTLASALDSHQTPAYNEALRRSKEEYINCHREELDGDLLKLVDRLF